MAERPTLIASVQRALRLLEAAARHEGGATAKRLAHETGLPLATTYHLLRTLVVEGYLRRLPDGAYVVGDRLDTLREDSRTQAALSRVRPALAALRDELHAAVYLSLYDDGEIRLLEVVDGPRAPRVDLWVGFDDAGHATALGKCILRTLGREERADYLARHPLADLTPHTITDRRRLLRALAGEDPVITDREEYAVGTSCLAAPVAGAGAVGAVAVSVPTRRLAPVCQAADRLLATAGRVSRSLAVTI